MFVNLTAAANFLHVTLEIEGIDRMYLNVYVPALQRTAGSACFFRFHRGHQFASSVWMDPITKTCNRNSSPNKANVPMGARHKSGT